MKNLLPDTLAFRTTTLLVLALAITHLVSNLSYTTDRETTLLSAGGEHAIQWVATMGAFSDTVSQEDWDAVISHANTDKRLVSMSAQPLVPADTGAGWREATLQRELSRHVLASELDRYRISYVAREDITDKYTELRSGLAEMTAGFSNEMVLISMQLGSGQWLNMAAAIISPPPFFSARLGLSMAVMLIAVVLISGLLVRRMTAPLKQLSDAAEKLGTDVQAPAIPETGPEEVRRTAHAFNVMQNRIRSYVEDRTQMLGAIAHDLGTPITRLRLRAEFVDEPELSQKMLRDLDDMQHMVSSTLAFIRDDSASEPASTVDLGSLIVRVCDDFTDDGHDVTLAEMPRWILVDCRPVALRRAIGNLVDNAVKYGNSAKVSMISDSKAIRILIEDNGPGIPKSRLEDVFQPFVRLEDSRNRETGGTGLGLSVARTILRAHGGDISILNQLSGGLCVEIRLPHSLQSPASPEREETDTKSKTPPANHKYRENNERTTTWKTL